ncbi:MAG: TrbC/VirB2 family protein [Pseudomonadota bacterium]|nr:TrbC/VirB2 family protein [Pseudomonadota bacterium]
MKFLKSNILSILTMTFLFVLVLTDCASASVFDTAVKKLGDLFRNSKMVIFVIGGFGLIALAFQAIFGKVKWAWFAALAFGLAVVAAAGAIVNYASQDAATGGNYNFSDTLQ